ncbi:MAG: hypothetical protein AAF840_02830 [Bacteroidota bacterium]
MRPHHLTFLIIILTSYSGLLPAQNFNLGFGVEVGSSWEIERLPYNAAPTNLTGVEGGFGYALLMEAAYEIESVAIAFRPALLVQQTTVFRLPGDDSGMEFRQKLYPTALLFPLRVSMAFGQQRFQPVLGLGGGFLVAATSNTAIAEAPRPEPVLPYLEVAVGVRFQVGKVTLRPELTVRNGTGELFAEGRAVGNRPFGGQRWGYAGFGVVVGRR